MLAIFLFDDVVLNQFLYEDLTFIYTLIIIPDIMHGNILYSIINNNIYLDTTTHLLIIKYFIPLFLK